MITKGVNIMKDNVVYSTINQHIQENFWLYVVSIFCLCTGVVLGIYSVKYMGSIDKNDLTSYINGFTSSFKDNGIQYQAIFFQTLKNNLPIIAAMWFLGLTMVGLPVIIILDLIKGFTLGFTISFMINSIGLNGIWVSLVGIIPQNIIYIPCILFTSVVAMQFSLELLKDRGTKKWSSNIGMRISGYSITFIIASLFMILGFFIEAYITPNLIKLLF